MDPTVVTCGACLVGSQLQVLEPASLVIANGHIEAIAPMRTIDAPADAHRIDLPRAILLPALVNAHVHLRDAVAPEAGVGLSLAESVMGLASARGRAIAKATRDQRIASMREALMYMASLGIALVGDFSDGGAEGVREVKDAAKDLAIDVVTLGRLDASVRAAPRPLHQLSADQRRELEAVLDVADGFAAATMNQYGEDAWSEIAQAVRSAGKLLAVHVAEDRRHLEESRSGTGRTDIERAVTMGVDHIVHLTSAEPDDLLPVISAGVPVVVCPRSNGATGSGFPPIRSLVETGTPVALGTDNVMINTPDLWREMEYASKALGAIARDPAAITPRDLLRAATAGGASALQRAHDLGTLEVGKLANLIAVDLDAAPLHRATDVIAALVHRVTPECILGRFHAGRWLPNRRSA